MKSVQRFFCWCLHVGSWKTTTQRKLTGTEDAGEMESIQEIYLQSCTSSCQMLLLRWNNPVLTHHIPRERVTSFSSKLLKIYITKQWEKKEKKVLLESLEFLELCLACCSQPGGAEETLLGLLLATARVAGRQHRLKGEKLHPTRASK